MERNNLTEGSILRNILNFSIPYMFAYFLQVLYGLADLFVVGQYCPVSSITAVSNGSQVMNFVTVVVIGLAMGSTVHIARAVGAKNDRSKARTIGNTITFFLLLALILSAVLIFTVDDIVQLIEVPEEAVADTADYLLVCFIGVPFIMSYNIIAAIFRGLGDSRRPMYFVAVACAFNIGLDYLFIGGFGWGAFGAALATSLSQLISVITAYVVISKHKDLLDVHRDDFRLKGSTIKSILSIGVPTALQDGFIQISFLVIAVIANGRGLVDAAAVGIVEKIIGLLFIIPSAMLSTVSAVSAQNIGAGKPERALATMKRAIVITAGFGFVASVLLQFFPHAMVSLFTSDASVIDSGSDYLRSYVWDCAFAGIHFCFSGYFTAYGYSIISFAHNFLSIICARLPLSYLLSVNYSDTLYPMGLASPTGSLLSVIICLVAYNLLKRQRKFV